MNWVNVVLSVWTALFTLTSSEIICRRMYEHLLGKHEHTALHCTLYLVLLNTCRIIVHTILNLRIIFVLESRGKFLPEFECVRNSENVSNWWLIFVFLNISTWQSKFALFAEPGLIWPMIGSPAGWANL